MKKIIVTLGVLAAFTLTLAGCQNKKATAPTNASTTAVSSSAPAVKQTATLIIAKADDDAQTKTVTLTDGQSVMEVLKENFTVEEKDGFITAIDGLAQDTTKNLYWMYDVNGTQAAKGAADTIVKPGDEIKFTYEAYN